MQPPIIQMMSGLVGSGCPQLRLKLSERGTWLDTFQITIQRASEQGWPVVVEWSDASKSSLPVRYEGVFQLDQAALKAQITPRDYGTMLGQALFRDGIRDAFSQARTRSESGLSVLLLVEDVPLRELRWERLCAPLDGGWDFLSLHQRTTFSHSSSYLPADNLAFSPDGQLLASTASDSPFREPQFLLLWNVATWEPVGQPISISGESLVTFSFSPDRHTLALVSSRGTIDTISTITLWDIVTGKLIHPPLIGDKGTDYTGMVFSPDGKQLALIGSMIGSNGEVGKIITLLNSVTLQPRFNPVYLADGYGGSSMTSTSDEQQLVILVLRSPLLYDPVFPPRLLIWDINPNTWLTLACSIANRNFIADEWSKFGDGGPYQKVCRDLPVDKTEVNEMLAQAQLAANKGDKQAASADYAQATQWAIETSNPDLNNVICLSGSFDQFAKEVLPSCERAIALGPDNGRYHNSRGLARALMEDRQGAIEDFQLFVTWLMENYPSGFSSKYRDERNAWITALEAGGNPFDTKRLQALRQECLDSSFCYTTFSSPYHPAD